MFSNEESEYVYAKGSKRYSTARLQDAGEIQGFLWLSTKGLLFQSGKSRQKDANCRIPWSRVDSVEVDGADALQKRFTVTRFALFGLFALALKKKTGEVFAYVESGSSQYLFRLPKMSAPQGRALFAPYESQMQAGRRARESASIPKPASTPGPRRRCSFCARMIPANSPTCPECGLARPSAESSEVSGNVMKVCPFCAEDIREGAIKCKHCGEWLNSQE